MRHRLALGYVLALLLVASPGLADEGSGWKELNEQSTRLYREQKFPQAAAAGRAALARARVLAETEGEQLAISLGNLAMIEAHLGRFPEAEDLAKEELAVRQRRFGQDSLDVLPAWNHLAIIYTLAGNMKRVNPDAEQCLLQMLAIEEKAHGRDKPAIVPTLRRLDKYYRITGNDERRVAIAQRLRELGEGGGE